MKDAHARKRESQRNSGDCPSQGEKVPTYPELLDEALDEPFPDLGSWAATASRAPATASSSTRANIV